MTENEAIEVLSNELIVITDMIGYCRDFEKESDLALMYRVKRQEAHKIAITALKEIQQYCEIGTVEECRKAMSRYREREKTAKCEECLFLEERKTGRNGAIIGICRIKPQNGRRYGKSCACRFFEKDYEDFGG